MAESEWTDRDMQAWLQRRLDLAKQMYAICKESGDTAEAAVYLMYDELGKYETWLLEEMRKHQPA